MANLMSQQYSSIKDKFSVQSICLFVQIRTKNSLVQAQRIIQTQMTNFNLAVLLFLIFNLGLSNIKQVSFEDYVQTFNKIYTPSQSDLRKRVYQENLARLLKEQKENNGSFNMRLSQYTDWTQAQLQKLKTKLPPIKNVMSNKIVSTTLSGLKNKNKDILVRGPIPSKLNWTALGKVTRPKNQFECGACYSFAAVSLIQSHLMIMNNISVDPKRKQQPYSLSIQYTLQCNPQGVGCDGGDPFKILDFAVKSGLPNESIYKYQPDKNHFGICEAENKTYLPENTGIVMSYGSSTEDLMNMLQTGPFLTYFSLYDLDSITNYAQGSYGRCPLNEQFTIDLINHAVLVVGYDQNNFIVKNSWGSTWGDNGYILIPKNRSCGIGKLNAQLVTCPNKTFYIPPTQANQYGYPISMYDIQCQACPQSCATCKNINTCTSCPVGMYLLAGTCVSSCERLTNANNATNCICPTGLVYKNSMCSPCPNSCVVCSSTNECFECYSGTFLDLVNKTCTQERCPPGRQRLLNTNTCTCENGTYRSGNQCLSCLTNCKYCTNNVTCRQCITGMLDETKSECISCQQQYCIQCTPVCVQCMAGYFLSSFDTKCYKQCPKNSVISGNKCVCTTMIDPQYSICRPSCRPNCFYCDQYDLCDACNQRYYLLNRTCQQCSPLCYNCTYRAQNCLSCNDGFYLKSNQCLACPPLCPTCNNPESCTSCKGGLQLVRERCVCPDNKLYNEQKSICLSKCPPTMVEINKTCVCVYPARQEGDACVNCPPLCAKCHSNFTCIECSENSSFINGICSCNQKFYFAGVACVQCVQPCLTCVSNMTCLSCVGGFKKTSVDTCCKIGTFWNRTQQNCSVCPEACTDCNQEKKCTSCKLTFTLTTNNTCTCRQDQFQQALRCIDCKKPCAICDNQQKCKLCLHPFLVVGGSCLCPNGTFPFNQNCINCSTNCSQCLNSLLCTSCAPGFYLRNSSCFSCPLNCFLCPEGICAQCSQPYILVNSVCVSNNCPPNCKQCYQQSISRSICTECNDGYFPNSTLQCELKNQTIWKSAVLNKKNVVPAPFINSNFCTPVMNQASIIDLGYTTVGGTNKVVVNSLSTVWIGNINFAIGAISSPNALSQPKITNMTFGSYPNRYTIITYGLADCDRKQNTTWSLYIYQNSSNSFSLQVGTLIGSRNNISISSNLGSASSALTRESFTLQPNQNKLYTYGYNCESKTTNCNLCWPDSKNCSICNEGYLIQNSSCVSHCSSGYVTYDNIKCQKIPSNQKNNTNDSGTNPNYYYYDTYQNYSDYKQKDGSSSTGVAVGVGVGVGIPLLIAGLVTWWCCWKRKRELQGTDGFDGVMPPESNRYIAGPVMSIPSIDTLPPPQMEPFPMPFVQTQVFVMPEFPQMQSHNLAIYALPQPLPAIPPAPPHYGYVEPVMYDPNSQSLQVSRALTIHQG